MNKIILAFSMSLMGLLFFIAGCTKDACPEVPDGTTNVIDASTVPQAVKDSFAIQYPSITVTWTREDADYEANFIVNYIKYSVVYSADAVRKIVESDASFTALPQAVQDGAHKDFDDEDIYGAAVLQDYVSNQTKYEVAIVESAKEKWDLIFDVDGNLLEKIKVCN